MKGKTGKWLRDIKFNFITIILKISYDLDKYRQIYNKSLISKIQKDNKYRFKFNLKTSSKSNLD